MRNAVVKVHRRRDDLNASSMENGYLARSGYRACIIYRLFWQRGSRVTGSPDSLGCIERIVERFLYELT